MESLPAWGVWIEILPEPEPIIVLGVSLPAWGVWIEMRGEELNSVMEQSLPAWGVWIEINL